MTTEISNEGKDLTSQLPKLDAGSGLPVPPTSQEAPPVTEPAKNVLLRATEEADKEMAAKAGNTEDWASKAEEAAKAVGVSTETGTLLGDSITAAKEPEASKEKDTKDEVKSEEKKEDGRPKEEVKPKEKTPSEEIKEAKDIAEALMAFNKHKGFEKPDLMGDFAGKCAEFGKIEDAMHFTKLAVETANSLRNQETQRRMEVVVDSFDGGINRLGQAIESGVQNANKVASRMQEAMDQASRAGNAMYQSADQLTKVANSISASTENFGDAGRRVANAAEQIDEASRRMGRGY